MTAPNASPKLRVLRSKASTSHPQSAAIQTYKTNHSFAPRIHHHRECLLSREDTLSPLTNTPRSLYCTMIYGAYVRIRRSDQFLLELRRPPWSHPQLQHKPVAMATDASLPALPMSGKTFMKSTRMLAGN